MTDLPHDRTRAVLEIDFKRQVQLSSILSSVEEFRDLIDPDLYCSALEDLSGMARVLEDLHDTQMSVSDRDLIALGVIVDAAWTFTNRMSSNFPITPLNQIGGLDDTDFCDLSGWLEQSRQRLFSLSREPAETGVGAELSRAEGGVGAQEQPRQSNEVTRPGSGTAKLEPTVVELGEVEHRQLLEILTYVKEIHFQIHPDMYKIGVKHFDGLKNLLKRSALQSQVAISSDELFLVELMVDAAWTYSYRSSGNGLPGVKDLDFDRLTKWAGRAHQAMIRSAGLPVLDLKN